MAECQPNHYRWPRKLGELLQDQYAARAMIAICASVVHSWHLIGAQAILHKKN